MTRIVVRARYSPEGRRVDREHVHHDLDEAHSHLNRLLRKGWTAQVVKEVS